jgi:coenzyme Q-binding protein COQ10
MPQFRTQRFVPFPPSKMYEIVADVESYPQFVPHCKALHVLSRKKEGEGVEVLTASMTVRYNVFEESYISRILLDPLALAIDVNQLTGPFKYIINTWRFEKAGEGTKIDFFLNYEFSSRALGLFMGPLFRRFFNDFAEAFEKRAQSLSAKDTNKESNPILPQL